MGQAILHVHSTFSDGIPTVDEIMDYLETHSEIDVVGFTDHDDVRAYAAALDWKARHPHSRIQPLWGCEVTIWGFKHLLAFIFDPPFPTVPWRKFMSLPAAAQAIHAAGGLIIVPHVDAIWVGLGRRRLRRVAQQMRIHGYELLTPVPGGRRAAHTLQAWAVGTSLVAVGGSDAHHLEGLLEVIVEFPGHSLTEFHTALRSGAVTPRWGMPAPPVPLRTQFRQHSRALVEQPSRQLRAWVGKRWVNPSER